MLNGSHSRIAGALALVLAIGTPACAAGGDWAFCVTRTVYSDPDSEFATLHRTGFRLFDSGSREGAVVVLGILLLPVAIDLLILPVTLTRDLTSDEESD